MVSIIIKMLAKDQIGEYTLKCESKGSTFQIVKDEIRIDTSIR